jgi:hypothetical protein
MKIKLLFFFFALLLAAVFSCENQSSSQDGAAVAAPVGDSVYLEKGKTIASATFAALSGELQAAMAEGGVPNAVEYCNLAAYPLVDSLSKVHQADIRRTSLKVRNPQNAPTAAEKTALEFYAQAMGAGQALRPQVQRSDDGTVVFYAPIQINAFCLQCHGKVGETLRTEDYAVIQKMYPEDRAVGYAEGDLRGIWSIRFGE